MVSHKLAICGTARPILSSEIDGMEVWTVGRSSFEGADRYYELHGLPSKVPTYRECDVPYGFMKEHRLPASNSICYMIAQAILEDRFDEIHLLATPLTTSVERAHQRGAVLYLLGYAHGKGIRVFWGDAPVDFNTLYMNGRFEHERGDS